MGKRTQKSDHKTIVRRGADRPERVEDTEGPHNVVPGDRNAVTGRFEAFAGPLPHPDHYAAYEQTLVGAADRILVLTERQSSHRQSQEAVELRANIDARTRGQWFAFIVALTSLGLGASLAAAGAPWVRPLWPSDSPSWGSPSM